MVIGMVDMQDVITYLAAVARSGDDGSVDGGDSCATYGVPANACCVTAKEDRGEGE